MRKQYRRVKTKKRYIIHFLTIRAEIKKNPLLSSYLGHWNACSRVSGWGHTYGYIQVESKLLESNLIRQDQFRADYENVYTTEVKLYAEFDHAKAEWSEKHSEELKKILAKYNLKLEEK